MTGNTKHKDKDCVTVKYVLKMFEYETLSISLLLKENEL